MKNLKNLGSLLLLFLVLISCEKEAIDENPNTELSLKSELNLFDSKADFEAYIGTLPRSEKNIPLNKAAMASDIIGVSGTMEELNEICSETVLEDFHSMQPNLFFQEALMPISSISEENLFTSPIAEGMSVSAENGNLYLVNFNIYNSQIYTGSSAETTSISFSNKINVVGLKIFNLGSNDYVKMELYNGSELKETVRFFSNSFQSTFIGVSSKENFDSVKIYSERYVAWLGLDEVVYGACVSDADGDGCMDEEDIFVNSNLEEIITVGDCSTGIENQLTAECGVYMSDMIGFEQEQAKNHGGFVSSVNKLTQTWVSEGLITETEKADIIKCAAIFKD